MFTFLREFGQETHTDERRAATSHLIHVVAYGVLIGLYCLSIAWHLAASARHRRAARLLDSARRAGVADVDDDQGC